MDEVYHAKPLSMSFCLNCHRDPAAFIRPANQATDLGWKWSSDPGVAASMQETNGPALVKHWHVESLQNCSACHR
jgi:mono/diheme cytochrome c family protein